MSRPGEEHIDYKKSLDKLLLFLERKENAVMVLATSADNLVMARSVLVFNDNLDLYFFTWKHSRKYGQIKKNSRVSLCRDKVEIEGRADILGLMNSEENREILEFMRKKTPDAIKKWEGKSDMIIVKIKPEFACVDGYYIGDDSCLEYIDFKKQYAYRIKWGS
jgi:general stress protein 26